MGKVAEERLTWGMKKTKEPKASTAPRRPGLSDQPHHRLLPSIDLGGGPHSFPSG